MLFKNIFNTFTFITQPWVKWREIHIMSRTEQIDIKKNVAEKTLQWKSQESAVVYYDKEADNGNGANVVLPIPFEFVVLSKDYVSFNGYNEASKQGLWSNEVKNNDKNAMVHMRLGNTPLMSFKKGDWQTTQTKAGIKDHPDVKGAKYTQILYISAQLPGDKTPQIYRLMLNGASFSGGIEKDKKGNELPGQENDGWIRFSSKLCKTDANAIFKTAISITGSKSKKNNAVNYTMPIFEATELDSSNEELYEKQYREVLDWFVYYNAKQLELGAGETVTNESPVREEVSNAETTNVAMDV